MDILRNIPCICIVMAIVAGIISSALPAKAAKWLNTIMVSVTGLLSAVLLCWLFQNGAEPFVYKMGQFPAPWGNELRVGVLEAGMACFFCVIMLLSLNGGRRQLEEQIEQEKRNLFYIMTDLLLASLFALVYTNDLFTAYVFVEINTISACGLIMCRQTGRTIEAATRYMIMSLLGSGLFLIGICLLYDMTGHLLMSNIKESVAQIVAEGAYQVPLMVAVGFMIVGLAIKSALFPFHTWLPDAYGYSTVSSAAILSSLVSKGYIFLVIKIIYRVIGFNTIHDSHIMNVLFVCGIAGMIIGSINAIKENDIRRMIAYSSVAQIGYIYMGLGLGTSAGVVASIFHILGHAATKSLLFIAAVGLTRVSGDKKKFIALTGAGLRNPLAGIAFSVGALSMVGIPMFSGFVSKLLFAQAAVGMEQRGEMLVTLIALAISTILNAVYFMKTVIRIYTPAPKEWQYPAVSEKKNPVLAITLLCFVLLNIILGMYSQPIVDWIETGLRTFA